MSTPTATTRPLAKVVHLTKAERAARGKGVRATVPLTAHAQVATTDGRDPVALLESQAVTRVAELVPIRYGRMLVSAFTFYRGAALIMATDLGGSANTGLKAQLCGDAHLSNFGVFASPERRLMFDANDFDETLPGPFEWDVKRLAASMEIAARDNGFKTKERRTIVLGTVEAYRTAMAEFATKGNLDVWYARLDMDQVMADFGGRLRPDRRKTTEQALMKARTRDNLQAFSKLTTTVDGETRFVSDPPLIVPLEDVFPDATVDAIYAQLRTLVRAYRRTLETDRRQLLEQFQLVHVARKVVGVGSVGTRAWVLLLTGIDGGDPLFLQAKEAQPSVLEGVAGASKFPNHGQRVVAGQRLMQAASDIFLGWQRTTGPDGVDRDYYLRQLRDWKASAPIEQMIPSGMELYGRLCGWTLARAHARSGDRIAITAYLGRKDTFDRALQEFAVAYADRNEADYAALQAAVDSGKVVAQAGL